MRIIRIDDTAADEQLYEAQGWTPSDLRDQPTIDLYSEVDRIIDRASVSAAEQRLAALRAARRLCRDIERAERNSRR